MSISRIKTIVLILSLLPSSCIFLKAATTEPATKDVTTIPKVLPKKQTKAPKKGLANKDAKKTSPKTKTTAQGTIKNKSGNYAQQHDEALRLAEIKKENSPWRKARAKSNKKTKPIKTTSKKNVQK